MSLLYRNGTGRTNIAWGGGNSIAANYLRRTSIGRNDISFLQISSNGTHNILNRTNTGRNNVQWINTVFSFINLMQYYDNYKYSYDKNCLLAMPERTGVCVNVYPSYLQVDTGCGVSTDYLKSTYEYRFFPDMILKKSDDETLTFMKTIKQLKFIGSNGNSITLNSSDWTVRSRLAGSASTKSTPCFDFSDSSDSVKEYIKSGTLPESERTSKYLDGYYNLIRIEFS